MAQLGRESTLKAENRLEAMILADSTEENDDRKLRRVPRVKRPTRMFNYAAEFHRKFPHVVKRFEKLTPAQARTGLLTGAIQSDSWVITTESMGEVILFYLKMTVTYPVAGTTAPFLFLPNPVDLIDHINFQPDSKGSEGEVGRPIARTLSFAMQNLPEDFLEHCKNQLGINEFWKEGIRINEGETKDIIIPILGTAFSMPELHWDKIFRKELKIEVFYARNQHQQPFFTTNYTQTDANNDAAALILESVVIEALCETHPIESDSFHESVYNGLTIPYYDASTYSVPGQTCTAGGTSTIKLTGLTGEFAAILVYANPTSATLANSRNGNRLVFAQPYEWELELSGTNVQGGLATRYQEFRNFMYPDHFEAAAEWLQNHPGFFMVPFHDQVGKAIGSGTYGCQVLKGQHSLAITWRSAGTNAVIDATQINTATGGANAGAATAGNYRVSWKCPLTGKRSVSRQLAWDASALTILGAIYEMDSWVQGGLATLRSGGSDLTNANSTWFGAGTSAGIGFGGSYANLPITSQNFQIIPEGLATGAGGLSFTYTLSATGVVGHTTGTYDFEFIGLHYSQLDLIGEKANRNFKNWKHSF